MTGPRYLSGEAVPFPNSLERSTSREYSENRTLLVMEDKTPPLKILKQRTSPLLDKMLVKLRRKRIVEKTKTIRWQSRLFTVPKKDSEEERLILDLSILNTFIKCPHFKMLTMKEVKLLLPKGFWTVSIDLKDGFWHVAISPKTRPYLGFRYRNKNWQFRAMPFGLNIAPRIFTKVIAHVVKVMAEAGIWCLPYLDDLLIIAATKEECHQKAKQAIAILESLGWLLNTKKSRLEPAQVFQWLGVHFDLTSHTAMAPQEKMNFLQQRLRNIITSQVCTKREIMRLQGIINWVGTLDPVVRLMISKTKYMIKFYRNMPLDAPIVLNKGMRLSLCKWVSHQSIPQSLGTPIPNIMILTDASLQGWGFRVNETHFQGVFDRSMSYSINILEMLTIWYALLMIHKKQAVIQVLCDNTTAVAVVRKGTSSIPHLSTLAELIWRRAEVFQWTLSIAHIQGSFNVIADQLSRNIALSTEWSLAPSTFQTILKLNPNLQVDLFATSLNNKLETFISPCPDMKATACDALTTPWNLWDHLYLYPPTNMISKVLAKLTTCSFTSAVLITPETPTRPWYMALKLHRVPSVLLEAQLQQIVVDRLVVMPQTSKLRVWRLSKKHTKEGFLTAKRQ